MVKPLLFKGEKRPKKRKHHEVSQDKSTDVDASNNGADENDSWTMPADASELTGPTVLVLPTVPLTCLASDLNGNIFASQLENLVEGNPKTAEPHSVQQVWVASRIVGMAENEVNLKGSHGAYLSCDQYGILQAKREARGREETFVIEQVLEEDARDTYRLRTAATKEKSDARYIGAEIEETKAQKESSTEDSDSRKKIVVALRGDLESSSSCTHLILRMQSKFKPQTAASKEAARVKEKISRQQLETDAGRKLTDEEAKRLKRARREGVYQESILDIRAKGKHDKYA